MKLVVELVLNLIYRIAFIAELTTRAWIISGSAKRKILSRSDVAAANFQIGHVRLFD